MAKKVLSALGVLFLIAGLLSATGCMQANQTPGYNYPSGMMGPGGMMGSGGMMGGPGGPYQSGGQRINLDKAIEIANNFLKSRNDSDLKVTEVMEFSFNFYVDLVEKSTGIHAFEALIDPYTGDIYPEPGPNMMWNTKYGAMSGMMWGFSPSAPMTVTEDQAQKSAQDFINGYLPGGKAGEVERFYGYYTLDFSKDNQIYGMVSVNGYTGQVWYHTWHGPFLNIKELD